MLTVFVDDNFSMDVDERYQSGVFDTYEEAEAKCKKIIDEFLESAIEQKSLWKQYEKGLTSETLYEQWAGFGENPFILPAKEEGFSAGKYVRKRCKELVK